MQDLNDTTDKAKEKMAAADVAINDDDLEAAKDHLLSAIDRLEEAEETAREEGKDDVADEMRSLRFQCENQAGLLNLLSDVHS